MGIVMTFLAHNICCFDRMDVFWNGRDSREFFMKRLNNMTLEHSVFERMAVFLTKSRLESSVLFGEWMFFTKYPHESDDFSVRNRKKRASY